MNHSSATLGLSWDYFLIALPFVGATKGFAPGGFTAMPLTGGRVRRFLPRDHQFLVTRDQRSGIKAGLRQRSSITQARLHGSCNSALVKNCSV